MATIRALGQTRSLRGLAADFVEPAPELQSDRVAILDICGSLFYAGAKTLGQRLPAVRDTRRAVVVLRLRGHGDVGSTVLYVVDRYAEQIKAGGGKLLLAGVDPAVKDRLGKTGHLAKIGEENVFVATEVIWGSTQSAYDSAENWLQQHLPPAAASDASSGDGPDGEAPVIAEEPGPATLSDKDKGA